MEVVILVLAHWLIGILLAIASLTIALTRFRSHSAAIVLAIVAGTYGIFLTMNQGIPTKGIHPIHLLSWFPILAAWISIITWYRARACNNEVPNRRR